MTILFYFINVLIGYLIGAIPFALIIGKIFFKTDIRNKGSGNLGASNAGRVLGKGMGVVITTLDILKASIAVVIVFFLNRLAPEGFNLNFGLYLTGFATLIGHCYPVYANFKGGKAVAATFGLMLIFSPPIFLIMVVSFAIMLLITKIVSVTSITSVLIMVLVSFIPELRNLNFLGINFDIYFSIMLIFVFLFVLFKHRSNIKRLINKNEKKVTWLDKKNKKEQNIEK